MRVEFTSLFEPEMGAGAFPVAALLRHAGLAEELGFDGLRVADSAATKVNPAGFVVLENAPGLGATLTLQAGALSPVEAADQFGLFDQLASGQLTLRLTPPPLSAFSEKHGAHDLALDALDEYATLLKRLWASDEPIDFEGRHYRLAQAWAASKPLNRRSVRLAFGGKTGGALQLAGKHADIFELSPAPLSALRQDAARIRQAALGHGRAARLGLSLAVRPVIEASGERAWTRASLAEPEAEEAQLLAGTAQQVALHFVSLIDLGIWNFTVVGVTDEEELRRFGTEVLPLVRNAAARQQPRGLRDLLAGTGEHGIYPGFDRLSE